MRTVLILLALCVIAAPARAQRTLDERYAAAPSGFIRIHSIVGSVRVTGWDRDSVVVTGTAAETKLDRFEVHGSYEGTKMGFFGEGSQLKPSHVEVRVPAGSQVWVKTASADVTVSGVTGGVDVYSVSGRLEIGGSPREVFAESMAGAVRVAADTRTVRAKSASGDIAVAGVIADVIATSVSGRVSAEGGAFERGRFETVDGDILYDGAIPRGSWLDFISHSGAVELVVPRATSGDFALTLFEGGFEDRFGVRPQYGGNKLKGQQVSFAIGDGGAHVTVRNFKGRTVLRSK
jgi:hypothetical protein